MTGSTSVMQGHRESKVSEEKLVIRRETGRDKVLFSFQQGRTGIAGSPALPAPGRQISGHLPASGSIENQTDSDTFHLSRTSSYLSYISYILYIS